jgi:CheY-like chemotaxis protein
MTKPKLPKHYVLYADDDPDDLQLVQEAFEQYANDVTVVTAANGSEALSYLEKITDQDPLPCLVILDVNMPVLDGKQALVRMRSHPRLKQVPVVLFTTSSMPADQHYAQQYKAGFITKPLNIKQMEMITDQFIAHCADEIREKIRRQIS